jgi:myo-inositol catabolism protein IolC
MSVSSQIIARMAAQFAALGPKPPWWSPLRRREWQRMVVAIRKLRPEEMQAVMGEIHTNAMEAFAAAHQTGAAMLRMSKRDDGEVN